MWETYKIPFLILFFILAPPIALFSNFAWLLFGCIVAALLSSALYFFRPRE